jgi:toxin ParE1/3/4
MTRINYSPKAEQDLRDIWRAVAENNPDAADRLLMRIFDKIELAAGQPQMGSPRSDVSPRLRILIEGSYIVLYEPSNDGIFVIAVVHGARDRDNWFE